MANEVMSPLADPTREIDYGIRGADIKTRFDAPEKSKSKEKITVYKDVCGNVYVEIRKRIYLNGEYCWSPIVGHTDEKNTWGVHRRVPGYQSYIHPGVKIGMCLVRDLPSVRPYAGVSDPLTEIIEVPRAEFPKGLKEQDLAERVMEHIKKR